MAVIEVANVENPAWVSTNQPFLDMVKRFVETDLKPLRSITYESMVNYLASLVDNICKLKLVGTPDVMIYSRVQIGMVDKALAGFQVFSMLADRLPHVSSMNYPYIYSENIRLTHKFLLEADKHRVQWGAKYILGTAVSDRLDKALERVFGGYTRTGTYFIADNLKGAIEVTK